MGNASSKTKKKTYLEALAKPLPLILLDNKEIAQFSFDVGGTLAKLVYVTANSNSPKRSLSISSEPTTLTSARKRSSSFETAPDININEAQASHFLHLNVESEKNGSNVLYELHFRRFNTFEEMIDFIKTENIIKDFLFSKDPKRKVYATGGGAFKYSQYFQDNFGLKILPQDEMKTLIYGVNFLLAHPGLTEIFTYNIDTHVREIVNFGKSESVFPYLLVNIGSGTSIIKVSGPDEFQRISGSTIGGGTYLGLCRLLTNLTNFDDIRDVEKDGRTSAVDLLVSDIYGAEESSLKELGLKGDVIASSFGKVSRKPRDGDAEFAPEDITRSLLVMICNTLCQIAYLNAQIEGVNAIYFAGGFLREKEYVWSKIEYAMKFWSKGKIKARFLSHDGYLGTLGSLIIAAKEIAARES